MKVSVSDKGCEVLKSLRQVTGSNLTPSPEIPASALACMPQPEREYFQAVQKSVLPGEDPVAFSRLKVMIETVSTVAEKMGIALPESVSLGTLSSQTANARMIELDQSQSEYLLVFDRKCLTAMDLFADFLAATADRHNISRQLLESERFQPKFADEELRQLDDIVMHLITTTFYPVRDAEGGIASVMLDLHPLGPCPGPFSKSRRARDLWTLFDLPMLAFLVAHELIHLHRRYTGTQSGVFRDELICDLEGAKLAWVAAEQALREARVNERDEYAVCSSPFVLSCLSLLEKASYTNTSGPAPKILTHIDTSSLDQNRIGDYPTAIFRRGFVRGGLQDAMSRPTIIPAASLCIDDWIMTLFDTYWTRYEDTHLKRWEYEKLAKYLADWTVRTGEVPPESVLKRLGLTVERKSS